MTDLTPSYDALIRHETAKRNAVQDMATYFLGQVALHEERIADLTSERDAWLSGLALGNVTPINRAEIGDITA
jgi:hypothetical protein